MRDFVNKSKHKTCISSVPKSNENSIEFSLSTQTRRVIKSSQTKSLQGGAIMHQVECNMFFKEHMERARMDVCDLGKTELILEMPWLAAHNPEIDWEKGEVKMMHCPPICGRRKQEGKEKKVRKIEKDEDKEALRKLVVINRQ